MRRQVERCLEELSEGRFQEDSLCPEDRAQDGAGPRQRLLFLRVEGWPISSDVVGMMVLEVAKVRGADMSTGNVVSFDVEPMLGMRIIPKSKVNV